MKYLVVSSFAAILVLLSISSAQAQVFGKNLYFGMQGDPAVSELQDFLTAQSLYSGPISGNFYFLTLNAVKAFQARQGISPAAGYFGPLTRAAAEKIAGGEVSASNAQAVSETGSAPAPSSSSTVQLQLEALLKQIASLQRQLANQQQINQAIQNPQTQVQQPTQPPQQTQQNVQPIPQTVPPPAPIAPVPAPTPPPPPPAPITVGTLNVARSSNFSADMDISSQTCSNNCGLTKIAEFAITASTEGFQLNNLSIELMASANTSMGTNNSRLQGVRMMVNGAQFGITLASPYPYGSPYGMITFSGSPLTIASGQTAIVDITAGIATAVVFTPPSVQSW